MTISIDKANSAIANFVFAHGAGANKDSEFMQTVTENLVKHGINVIRFNFEYMQKAISLQKRSRSKRWPLISWIVSSAHGSHN